MDFVDEVLKYAEKQYEVTPDRPWRGSPDNQVLRHQDSGKWFGLVMPVRRELLGLNGEEIVYVLNLKCDPLMSVGLRSNPGILPAYHMNHTEWISVLLDGTVDLKTVCNLMDLSYELTASKKTKRKLRGPMDWLVPANPKYFDIVHAFDDTDEIMWKQSNDIRVGDTVYMYVAAPVGGIMYKCRALEVKIPSEKEHRLNIKWLMRIKLLDRYDPEAYSRDVLKTYGIYAVRGPRSMPHSLVEDMNR